jgi:hypothetical protein
MSPDRVPMSRPSSGVKPIEVSMLRPRSTAASVTEVDGDDSLFGGIPAEELAAPERHVPVGRSVEAVATDLMFRVELKRDAVQKGVPRHGLVECRVENRDVGDIG